jgi:DnaJ-class molecular chaperone
MTTCNTCHGTRHIVVQVEEECPTCEGSGTVLDHNCQTCHGTGKITNAEEQPCPDC